MSTVIFFNYLNVLTQQQQQKNEATFSLHLTSPAAISTCTKPTKKIVTAQGTLPKLFFIYVEQSDHTLASFFSFFSLSLSPLILILMAKMEPTKRETNFLRIFLWSASCVMMLQSQFPSSHRCASNIRCIFVWKKCNLMFHTRSSYRRIFAAQTAINCFIFQDIYIHSSRVNQQKEKFFLFRCCSSVSSQHAKQKQPKTIKIPCNKVFSLPLSIGPNKPQKKLQITCINNDSQFTWTVRRQRVNSNYNNNNNQ